MVLDRIDDLERRIWEIEEMVLDRIDDLERRMRALEEAVKALTPAVVEVAEVIAERALEEAPTTEQAPRRK